VRARYPQISASLGDFNEVVFLCNNRKSRTTDEQFLKINVL
jgi:hypothetical protein